MEKVTAKQKMIVLFANQYWEVVSKEVMFEIGAILLKESARQHAGTEGEDKIIITVLKQGGD